MTIPEPSATAQDLRALADLVTTHPELDSEITAAVAELHVVLAASALSTPAEVAQVVVDAGGRDADPLHADPSFDSAEVTLPAGVITLTVHKMWPDGAMLPRVAADAPVTFDTPDELTRMRASVANLLDELRALFVAPDQQSYSRARVALVHRMHELEQGR